MRGKKAGSSQSIGKKGKANHIIKYPTLEIISLDIDNGWREDTTEDVAKKIL